MAVPAMLLPVAATGAAPERVGCKGRRQIAYAVSVVVDFRMDDVTTGDTDTKRNMGVGTRHGKSPRVLGTRPAAPRRSTNRGYGLSPSRGRVLMSSSCQGPPTSGIRCSVRTY